LTKDAVLLILARCASFDQRTIGKADVEAWHLVIGYMTHAEAERAVVEHYSEESRRIWPADIVRRVEERRNQWFAAHPDYGPDRPDVVPPWATPEEWQAMWDRGEEMWRAGMTANRERIRESMRRALGGTGA